MPRSAKLKGLNLRYPIAWRDFLLRNTMSTGKLRNMMFKISHFWDEKRPTKKSEDRIPTMLLPASPQPAIPRPALKDFWNNRRQESVPFVSKVHPSSPSRLSVHGPLWRTSETIGVGSYAIRFKSPSQRPVTDVRPRPAPTARSDGLLKQSAWEALPFVSKVHPSGPSRTSVHGPPPRPALKGFWNNRREELVPFVSKVQPSGPSRTSVHGPLWQTSETIGVRNSCRLFQKSIPAARHGRPSTARPHGPLWRTSETIGVGSFAIRFKSPSQRPVTDVRPRPAPTARSDGLLKQSAWEALPFVSKVHPSGPSRTSVHGPPPRPALKGFWNNRREELVQFVSKVHPSGPSRTSVHSPLWQTSETIGVRNSCRLFQKSIPAARHGRPSTARPHGPLWRTSATIGARNPCHLFRKPIAAARQGRPSTTRSHSPLWLTQWKCNSYVRWCGDSASSPWP